MSKPYQLLLFSPAVGGGTPEVEDAVQALERAARGYRRSTRAIGGFWQASFALTEEEATASWLRNAYEEWLAHHLVERIGGGVRWEGLVYEIDLVEGGVRRRRTLERMWNAVRGTYRTMDYVGDNLAKNGGFENAGAGGGDVVAAWYENPAASGAIAQAAVPAAGSFALQLTAGGGDEDNEPDTWVRQNFNVTPNEMYEISFQSRGDGSLPRRPGRFAVRDPNASQWIIPPTFASIGDTTYGTRTIPGVMGPSDGEFLVFFYPPNENGRVAYFDEVTVRERVETVYELDWAITEESIAQYGRREQILTSDDYPEDTAAAYRDTYLKSNGWPRPRTVSISRPTGTYIEVKACGYVFTANWLYTMAGDGSEGNISTWIAAMAGTDYGLSDNHGGTNLDAGDMEFLRAGQIDANTLQRRMAPDGHARPWDIIAGGQDSLVALGDASGNPWRCWVGPGRQLHYQQVDTDPQFYLKPDGIYDTIGARTPTSPWLIDPSVIRDLTSPRGSAHPGSFLQSRQDSWVEEVEMADGWPYPALRTSEMDEADIAEAQLALQEFNGDGGGDDGTRNWWIPWPGR